MSEARDPGAAYRAISDELPPPALDRAILDAARAAAVARRPARAWSRRWGAPLALAASVVLGLGIVLRVAVERPDLEPVVEPAPRVASAPPAPAVAGEQAQRESAPPAEAAQGAVAIPPDAAAGERRAAAGPEAAKRIVRGESAAVGAAPARAVASQADGVDARAHEQTGNQARAVAASPSAAGQGPAATAEPPPAKVMADAAPAVTASPAPAAPSPAASSPFASPPPAPPAAAARMAAPAPPATEAPETRARLRAESGRRDAAPAATGATGAVGEAFEAGLTPEAWLRHIVELRRAGRNAEADASLARFVRRHPDLRVPSEAREAR